MRQHFNLDSGLFTAIPNSKRIRALCAYEGAFVSQNGRKKDFTPELLAEIVTASNLHLDSGIQSPVFYSNHEYGSQDKIGLIVGPFVGQEITEADLPNEKLTELVGKFGVFTEIELVKEEAIADYEAKLLKPISMGIDFSGQTFPKNAIFEISCVAFSAIPGAQLFNKKPPTSMDIDFDQLVEEALALQGQFGLNLNDRLMKEQLMPALWGLFDAYTGLIREILESEEDEKETLLNQATSDLAVAIAARIQTAGTPVPADPNSPTPFSTTPEDEEDMSQIEDLQNQLAELKTRAQMSEKYFDLVSKAEGLFAKGLITPAQLAEFKAPTSTPEALIETFSLTPEAKGADSAIAGLDRKLIELETIEKYGRPHPAFANPLGREPLPTDDGTDPDAEAFLGTYSIRSPLYATPIQVIPHAN